MAIDARIDRYVAGWKGVPFAWMHADCWAFAGGWLDEQGHEDRVEEITDAMGEYTDLKEYLRRGKETGLTVSPRAMKAETTMVKPRAGLPQPGDVAVIKPGPGFWMLGLVSTKGEVIVMTEHGPQRTLPVMDAIYFEVI